MTPHIGAKKDEIADIVIMPGDPLRVKYIAEKYLEKPELVNNVRLNLAYTGYYKNNKVTIFSSGMGCPSMGIYAYELFKEYGVKKIIRVGSCGSYHEEIEVRDIIIAEKAFTLSNFAKEYNGEKMDTCKSSVLLSQKIVNTAHKNNINVKIGTVHTTDVFYNQELDQRVKDNYSLVAEMECFALFYMAKQFDKQAAAILTVSDNIITKECLSSKDREQTFDEAITLALESTL